MSWQPGKPSIGGHRPDLATLEQRVIQLEQQLADLMKIVNVEADGAVVTIASKGVLTLKATTVLSANGALVKLNNGGKPIGRMGDPIAGNSLIGGNPAVLA
jgi:hypothetical protein